MIELIVFILIIALGYVFLGLIMERSQMLERLTLSVLVGSGFYTMLLFLLSWAGIKITLLNMFLLILVLLILYIFVRKPSLGDIKIRKFNTKKMTSSLKWYEYLIILFLVVLGAASLLLSSYYPITSWDALALYDFRAKIIAEFGYFVQIANNFEDFATYPLLTSMLHAIIYITGGLNPKYIYSLYYISFMILCFVLLQKRLNRRSSLFLTLVIVSNPALFTQSVIAYTNLPYAVYLFAGLVYLFFFLAEDRKDYLIISALMLGFSTWTRSSEPFWLTGVFFVFLYSLYKKKYLPLIIYLPVLLVIQQPWKIYQTRIYGEAYSTSTQLAAVGGTILQKLNVDNLLAVFDFTYKNILLYWGLVLPILGVVLLFNLLRKIDKNNLLFLSIIFLNFILMLVGIYFFSLSFPEWMNIPGSATRMTVFFPPLIIFYAGLVMANKFKMFRD